MIFCLFVLNLLGFGRGRVVRWGGDVECGVSLFYCGSWGRGLDRDS